VSITGISLAVAVLLIVLSVMNGFEHQLQQRVLGVAAHSTIQDFNGPILDWNNIGDKIMENPEVLAIAPYIDEQSLIVFGEDIYSVNIRGIDANLETKVSDIGEMFLEGELLSLLDSQFNIIIGSSLSKELGARIGDRVIIMTSKGVVTPIGLSPRMRAFNISGIFDVGMYEYDRGLAYINLEDARLLYNKGSLVDGVRLYLDDAFSVSSITDDIIFNLGKSFYSNDWTSRYVNFFRSIQITKSIMFVILSLIIVVAVFNIISTLVMVVREKRSDIAILETLGASRYNVLLIFLIIGSLIGIIGTTIGIVLGMIVSPQLTSIIYFIELFFNIDLLAEDVYFLSDLPTQIRLAEVLKVSSFTVSLSIIATFFPAISATRKKPLENLNYE
jgi:lipoprotein-releasing system permease protein